ncbi:hypothetical protein U1769_11340 [Sphingomonas sp. ZT3P38]|uniref:hypothetical protein n=1 Tax=Parasphingomonas zepuensis TaxID=3096161 RepID=UPI002FCB2D49
MYSRRLKAWRAAQTHPFLRLNNPFAGHVAGAQIGNLTPRFDWPEWDFADKAGRARTAQDAANAIREIIFPFFAAFERTETVLPLVNNVALWPKSLVEYLLVAAGPDAASEAGASYLAADPLVRGRFERALLELSQNNVVSPQGDLARDLAALSVATGLRFSE